MKEKEEKAMRAEVNR